MSRWLRALILTIVVAAAVWGIRASGFLGGDPWDPMTLRRWIEQAGFWGPAVFLAIAVAKPLFAPQPIGLTWIAGGLFGVTLGGALIAVSGLVSAFVGYAVGSMGRRLVGGDQMNAGILEKAKVLGERVNRGRGTSWRTIAFLRVVIPWDFLSYWAGMRRLPLRIYLGGTVVALLPVSFGYAYVASAFVTGEGKQLALAVPVLLAMVFGPAWYLEKGARQRADCG